MTVLDAAVRQRIADEILQIGLDASAFCDWLDEALGNYNANNALADSVSSRAEDRKWLARLAAELEAVSRRLAKGSMPARVEVAVSLTDEFTSAWSGLADRLRIDLTTARFKVTQAAAKLEKPISPKGALADRKGRPALSHRDTLLADVFKRIRPKCMSHEAARKIASAVLVHCRVPVPEDDRALEKVIDGVNGKN